MTFVLIEDPRLAEYRAAVTALDQGLSAPQGAHERYSRSLTPYLEFEAERTPENARKYLMRALFDVGLPLGVIAFGFRATEAEIEYVADHPPIAPEPVDEQERLAALPYGLYLKTEHWYAVRKAALERYGHKCAICNIASTLEVHHRSYKRLGAERPADVIVMCSGCHTTHHGKRRAA